MKRSVGITAIAVVTMIGSFFFLLLSLILLYGAASFQNSRPETAVFVRLIGFFVGVVTLLFFFWGITTAVGLLKLQAWSRTSIVVFSGILVSVSGFTGLMGILAPLAPVRDASPMTGRGRIGITIFYSLLVLLGAGWLRYFNSTKIKDRFKPPKVGPILPDNSRTLSLTIVGGFVLFTSVGRLHFCIFAVANCFSRILG